MILCAYFDAGFLNDTNSRSCTGAHIFLSENKLFPRFNGAILSIAQIIKFVMDLNLQPFYSRQEGDSPPANHHHHGVAPTKKALSK
jgi:hypothetical protein